MTDEKTEQAEVEQVEPGQDGEVQHSRIIIEFEHPGDADPQNIYLEAVTIGQVQIAAERLRMMAERQLLHKWAAIERQEMQKMAQMAQVQELIKGGAM